ncbi:MAG: hypothetical protein A2511_06265 [Deltaproteobacteria bacterium RIFOXYD12_FULL_50_9]|nr:MAG: hypothetical protein A2511_06265 [Deltaproteobacteria bacterium RIFOXYD12_FULL_50_9]
MPPRQLDHQQISHVFLKPGEMYLTRHPAVIQTVLGSCVSVIFYNARISAAAMCHALLPRCKEGSYCDEGGVVTYRYVDSSVNRMLAEFSKLGISGQDIEAKLFGGASMFEKEKANEPSRLIGNQNVVMARQLLDQAGVNLVSFDTGGYQGRKLFFKSDTGEVLVKLIQKMDLIDLGNPLL